MKSRVRQFIAMALLAVSGAASAGTFTLVTEVPGSDAGTTTVLALNDGGMLGGSYASGGITHGMIGSLGGAYTSFDYSEAGFAAIVTQIRGLDSAGNAVGFAQDASGNARQFHRSAGGAVTTLVDPNTGNPLTGPLAHGLNDAGAIVGSYQTPSGRRGYILSPDRTTLTTLTNPGAIGSTNARGINSSGTVVGWSSAGAFVFSAGTYTPFAGPAGSLQTILESINDAGDIAGQYTDASNDIHGFVFHAATNLFTILDAPGATFTAGWQINNLGQVALTSDNGSYIWTPGAAVPAPGTLALLGVSLFALGLMRRRGAA